MVHVLHTIKGHCHHPIGKDRVTRAKLRKYIGPQVYLIAETSGKRPKDTWIQGEPSMFKLPRECTTMWKYDWSKECDLMVVD